MKITAIVGDFILRSLRKCLYSTHRLEGMVPSNELHRRVKMIEIIRVIYAESVESAVSAKNFDMKERRAATNFAKSISKKSGRSSTVVPR